MSMHMTSRPKPSKPARLNMGWWAVGGAMRSAV